MSDAVQVDVRRDDVLEVLDHLEVRAILMEVPITGGSHIVEKGRHTAGNEVDDAVDNEVDDAVDDQTDDGADDADDGAGAPIHPDGRPELSLVGFGQSSGLTPEDPGWQELALCAQTDPEAFFPEKGGSTREAKRVCLSCEVRQECLEYALGNDERFGIWGGLSERERRRLKRNIG